MAAGDRAGCSAAGAKACSTSGDFKHLASCSDMQVAAVWAHACPDLELHGYCMDLTFMMRLNCHYVQSRPVRGHLETKVRLPTRSCPKKTGWMALQTCTW
eukprot:scaffold218361_cov15-Tisochrysis_lutea.AAC.1